MGDKLQIKASGGIRSYHDAIRMLDAVADRIAVTSSDADSHGNAATVRHSARASFWISSSHCG